MLEKLRQIINRKNVREGWQRITDTQRVNLDEQERIISVIGGGLVTVLSLFHRRPGGLGYTLIGGYLLYRGLTGYCPLYKAAGLNTISPIRQRQIRAGNEAKYQPDQSDPAVSP